MPGGRDSVLPGQELIPVVSYERISADTAKDAHGVADQRKINEETASLHDWRIVARFTDNDRSAAKPGVVREGFETMLKVLRAGRLSDGTPVQGVVVVADDRLVRRAGDYERFVEALTYDDDRVYADAKGAKNLYSEDVESMGLFGAVISKMEVRKIQRRMRRSHRRRAEEGIAVGGTRPFGWNADRLTLHPVEAPLIRQAVEDFISGRTVNSIVKQWRTHDVKTSLGNDWTPRSLKLAIWNPRLCGWRRIGPPGTGELVYGPEGEPVTGSWEPIVTPEQWTAVDAIFQARRSNRVREEGSILEPLPIDFREPRYLLTGFLRCGRIKDDGSMCGVLMRCQGTRKDLTYHYYYCPGQAVGGCGGTARRGDLVDEYVTEAVLAKLEERHAAARTEQSWPGAETLLLLKTKRGELVNAWRKDLISSEVFWPEVRSIEAQIKTLQDEQARRTALAERAALDVHDIRATWFSGDLELSQKRQYIREALHAVVIHPSGGGRKSFNPDLIELVWREN